MYNLVLNFLTGIYNRIFIQPVSHFLYLLPLHTELIIYFIYLCLYIYSIYRAGRTWHQSVVSGSGCPLSWPGVAWRGVVVQVCNMDGGASHSAERWMALFMLLFAAEKVDTPLPSHWFLNFRLTTGPGVSSCWIRQESWSLLLFLARSLCRASCWVWHRCLIAFVWLSA